MKSKACIGAALAALFLFVLPADAEAVMSTPPAASAPAGAGTVIDSGTDEDGKEFYTIQTPDEAVFYLIIDRRRSTENVYFLDAVTARDLLSLAKLDAEPTVTQTTAAPQPEALAQPEQQSFSNLWLLLAVLAVVAVGGGVGYYFKIYRPRHRAPEPDEDDGDEPAPWDDDANTDEETEENE